MLVARRCLMINAAKTRCASCGADLRSFHTGSGAARNDTAPVPRRVIRCRVPCRCERAFGECTAGLQVETLQSAAVLVSSQTRRRNQIRDDRMAGAREYAGDIIRGLCSGARSASRPKLDPIARKLCYCRGTARRACH